MAPSTNPPLAPGTRVRTTKESPAMQTKEMLPRRKWGVKGRIVTHDDAHGLCYDIEHEDGTEASYDPSEFVVLPKLLSDLIAEWEADATQREHQSEHGSAMSSMREDTGEGMVAKRMREMIEELKASEPNVAQGALVDFTELKPRAWFIFPEAISRLTRPGAVCREEERWIGPIHVKIGPYYYARLEDEPDVNRITILADGAEECMKVVEIKKPNFVAVA